MRIKNYMKKGNFIFTLFISLLFLGFTTALFAEAQFKIIDTNQLKKLFAQKKTFLLIDARSPQEYQEAHIKSAVSIPEKNFDENKKLLPADKSTLIVIYCNGVQCGKSKKLAEKIIPLGYTNVSVYSEGFPVWEERVLPIVAGSEYGKKIETRMLKPDDLKIIIDGNKSDYVLVDVRDASEYRQGHIPTAINIPSEKFASESGILPKNKKIIVYCNTGSRSYLSYRKLISLAYPDINQTLLADWKNAKMKIEK
ncbi:MAG TPA: rhodanese-like domain-containing protein [Spirochaetota bacterium]|nr:rhodanese-like domain-containing protein [Spirochaetota bacterium]HPS88334.1 rhodanese-like domain-containing protein [Spirochaetota bacterium]